MSDFKNKVLVKRPENLMVNPEMFILNKYEMTIQEFKEYNYLSEILHPDFISNYGQLKPIKMIKIGNGGSPYTELKSIIILENSDFMVIDKDGRILDYFTNQID